MDYDRKSWASFFCLLSWILSSRFHFGDISSSSISVKVQIIKYRALTCCKKNCMRLRCCYRLFQRYVFCDWHVNWTFFQDSNAIFERSFWFLSCASIIQAIAIKEYCKAAQYQLIKTCCIWNTPSIYLLCWYGGASLLSLHVPFTFNLLPVNFPICNDLNEVGCNYLN